MVLYKELFKMIEDKFVYATITHFVIKNMCIVDS